MGDPAQDEAPCQSRTCWRSNVGTVVCPFLPSHGFLEHDLARAGCAHGIAPRWRPIHNSNESRPGPVVGYAGA